VDTSSYGRLPDTMGLFMAVLRSAMGDFSLIDPYQGFDLYKVSPTGEIEYRHSKLIVIFTFLIFMLSVFALFMIFMNFIIAVIGESYSKVTHFAEAHDYHQRSKLIYEMEVHFSRSEIENPTYFPRILIVRKKKLNSQ
jgi:hypothetical protein